MRCRWDFGDSLRFSPDPQIAFRPIWRTWNCWTPPLALWRTLKEPSRPKNVDSWHGRVDMMYVICFYICSYMYTLYIICILSFVRCFMFSESTREEEYFFDQSNFPGSCSWVRLYIEAVWNPQSSPIFHCAQTFCFGRGLKSPEIWKGHKKAAPWIFGSLRFFWGYSTSYATSVGIAPGMIWAVPHI